ncbi:hypothetical protein BGZ95_001675 [Linnemannia exigua]|uniref:Phospholipid/glycerol acyltransferase domain-containing protein n=1 Tax=Linnemannia exigua TaxID=604196 RepID=A0AAD4D6Y5_9FUNG|nr:hypothetical protein BGZ95_001675 [Linnemannia exigua]
MAIAQTDEAVFPMDQRHVHNNMEQQDKTATAKRATLVPLVASTLSPLSSPVTSPAGSPPGSPRASPSILGLSTSGVNVVGHPFFLASSSLSQQQQKQCPPHNPLSANNTSVSTEFATALAPTTSLSTSTSPPSSSSSSSSSSSTTTTLSSFSATPSSVFSDNNTTTTTSTTSKEHSMTVAKLDPNNNGDGGVEVLNPTAAFSPPLSPLSNKKNSSFSSSTTTTTATTTKTTITVSDNKTAPTTTTHTSTTKTTTTNGNGHPAKANAKYEVFDKETGEKVLRSRPRKGPKMNPVYKSLRAFAWALYFNLGASLISMTQVLSLPLAVIAPGVYRRHINRTEGHFGAFLLKMNQLFAPSDIVLTGDESIRGIVKVYKGRRLQHSDSSNKDGVKEEEEAYGKEETILDMPERMIFISNHQIYSDWMYLWCFSYFAEKHRALKIILRGDLTWIPVFGW